MNLSQLSAISPVDGRYRTKTEALAPYLSEFGLIRYRVGVEVEYLIALANAGITVLEPVRNTEVQAALRELYQNFSEADAQWIKDKESITNHDVKAVEYFVKFKLDELKLSSVKEFVHFSLTSQDINNTSVPLSLKEAVDQATAPLLNEVLDKLKSLAQEWKDIPMLARTHGQPASPTRVGKEFYVFVSRLEEQIRLLNSVQWPAKFGGATGNFNAHHVAYPEISWVDFADAFVASLGLKRSEPTTQIEHYDNLAAKYFGESFHTGCCVYHIGNNTSVISFLIANNSKH